MVERFGAQAVYGRSLAVSEMRAVMLTENVVDAYESRKASGSYAEWSEKHPASAKLLADAERAYRDGE